MTPALDSGQLEAFFEVSRLRHFSKAARALAISQPALSQRIQKLERELGSTLLIRQRGQAGLTETGHRLLAFCLARRELEAEFRRELSPDAARGLGGVLRIAAFSTVTRSVVLPIMGQIMESAPGVRIELSSHDLPALPALLRHAKADLVLTDQPIAYERVRSERLGDEAYVLVESAKAARTAPTVYLDHDPDDLTTARFLRRQTQHPAGGVGSDAVNRAFFGEIYAIIDAAARGLGRAVIPIHLLRGDPRLRVVRGYRAMKSPVYLNYPDQLFYPRLTQVAIERLRAEVARRLRPGRPTGKFSA